MGGCFLHAVAGDTPIRRGGRHVAEPAHAVAARARGGRRLPGRVADAPAQGDGHVARPGKTRRRIRDDYSLLPSETLDEEGIYWFRRREKVKNIIEGTINIFNYFGYIQEYLFILIKNKI